VVQDYGHCPIIGYRGVPVHFVAQKGTDVLVRESTFLWRWISDKGITSWRSGRDGVPAKTEEKTYTRGKTRCWRRARGDSPRRGCSCSNVTTDGLLDVLPPSVYIFFFGPSKRTYTPPLRCIPNKRKNMTYFRDFCFLAGNAHTRCLMGMSVG
jgi:hypothetical protein